MSYLKKGWDPLTINDMPKSSTPINLKPLCKHILYNNKNNVMEVAVEVKWSNCRLQAYLAEVANGVTSLRVPDGHNIKEKGLYIIVECFVVQEELG